MGGIGEVPISRLGRQGGCRCGVRPDTPGSLVAGAACAFQWCLPGELQVRAVRLFRQPRSVQQGSIQYPARQHHSCKSDPQVNWKVGVQGGKYGPMGEDLFAQTCLDVHGVRRIEAFDITTDGACPADRPVDEKKNKKWKPNCAEVSTAAMHPFKKLDEWVQCHEATVAAFGK